MKNIWVNMEAGSMCSVNSASHKRCLWLGNYFESPCQENRGLAIHSMVSCQMKTVLYLDLQLIVNTEQVYVLSAYNAIWQAILNNDP